MSILRAVPFRTADEALNAELEQLPPEVHRRPDDTLDAYSDVSSPVTLNLSVAPDLDALEACLPPCGLDLSDAVEIALVTQSVLSRRRLQQVVTAPGSAQLAVTLDPREHMGRLDMLVVARLRRELEPVAGFAHLKGSVISSQLVTSVWFDEPPTFSGDSLDIVWRDFDEDPVLEDGHLFALGLDTRPVIYLNEAKSMRPLRSVLESKGTHGTLARVRDAVFQQIVHQAWTSILGHAFMEVQRYGEEGAETVLESLEEWVALVLREWSLALVPEEETEDAAALALIDRVREPGNQLLLVEVPAAIQRKFETMKGFRGLAREFIEGA